MDIDLTWPLTQKNSFQLYQGGFFYSMSLCHKSSKFSRGRFMYLPSMESIVSYVNLKSHCNREGSTPVVTRHHGKMDVSWSIIHIKASAHS